MCQHMSDWCKLFGGKKHPDYAPSLKLGHKQVKSIVTPPGAVDRYERSQKGEELKRESLRKELFETLPVKMPESEVSEDSSDSCKPKPEQANTSSVAVQKDIDFEFNGSGKRFLDLISEEAFKDNDEEVLFYTGLPSYAIRMTVFNHVKDNIIVASTSSLTKFQQFVMVLMKLRLGLLNQDLGYRFEITGESVSRQFYTYLIILFE